MHGDQIPQPLHNPWKTLIIKSQLLLRWQTCHMPRKLKLPFLNAASMVLPPLIDLEMGGWLGLLLIKSVFGHEALGLPEHAFSEISHRNKKKS